MVLDCGVNFARFMMKTPLIPYRSVSPPPPIVPEIMGIPQMAKSATIRGSLHKDMDISNGVEQHFTMWDGGKIRYIQRSVY